MHRTIITDWGWSSSLYPEIATFSLDHVEEFPLPLTRGTETGRREMSELAILFQTLNDKFMSYSSKYKGGGIKEYSLR